MTGPSGPKGLKMNGYLSKQFNFFLKHRDELVEKYSGKVVVICDEKVEGAFDSELEALEHAQASHKLGEFLVQRVEKGAESYTQTFHSRVAFS